MVPLARTAFILITLGILAAPALSKNAELKWNTVTPSVGTAIEIKGKKSSAQYYKLDKKTPVSIKVVGPGSLKVFARTEMSAGTKDAIFGMAVIRDNEKRYLISRTAKLSKSSLEGSKSKLSEQKSVTFKVPKGTHEFALTLPSDAGKAAFVRFAFAEKPAEKSTSIDVKYVPFLPRKFADEVRIIVKEEEYIYYRVSKSAGVEVEIIGPAKLKIVSRLEFANATRNERSYRLQIGNDTEIVQTIPLKAKISATASYRKASNLVLGRGDTSYLDVPAGRHRYTISSPDKDNSFLVRFYLPEKALGNEWKPSDTNSKAELRSIKSFISKG